MYASKCTLPPWHRVCSDKPVSAQEVVLRVRSTKNTLLALLFMLALFGATTGDAVAGKLNLLLQQKVAESPDQSVTALVFLTADAGEVASLSSSVISIKNFGDRYKVAY
jgi:hypothetical protein